MSVDYARPVVSPGKRVQRTERVRVSGWVVKDSHGERLHFSGLREVVEDFNRLMRPARSDGDFAPTSVAALGCIKLLAKTMSPGTVAPILVPRFGGGIQMEWHQHGVDLEISVEADGSMSAWCEEASGREWEDSDPLDIPRLKKELSLLIKHE